VPSFFNVKFSTNPLKRLRLRGRGRDCCLLLLGGIQGDFMRWSDTVHCEQGEGREIEGM
jgi:hypothetical protein